MTKFYLIILVIFLILGFLVSKSIKNTFYRLDFLDHDEFEDIIDEYNRDKKDKK